MYRYCFYIDGFNMYYALNKKYPQFKWLNYYRLAESTLLSHDKLEKVSYFSAYVKWKTANYKRHQNYITALRWAGVEFVPGRFKKKDMIFLPGDAGDKVYLLKAGVVKISKYSDNGKEIILGMVNPGEIFGEMALVDKGPRDSVAEAIMDSYVCFIDRENFSRYLARNPEMSLRLTKIFGLKFNSLFCYFCW